MILHIASWYPGPWDSIEGNFIRDQIAVFREALPAQVVVVQVRPTPRRWPRISRPALEGGARGYILHAPVRPGSKVLEWLSTLLLVMVLLRERAWRFEALHFHIAYPLLMHSRLWRRIFRRPIVISEHWSAYHYKFHLPEGSRALDHMRRPFQQGFPVLAVSDALLADIRSFAQRDDFKGFVLPNVVPLHGSRQRQNNIPVFFMVNSWVEIKDPMPMLKGLALAAQDGLHFTLVLGGAGPLLAQMKDFVQGSVLADRTTFLGWMTKQEIATELGKADGYLFSSRYETFSVACAEALGAGVPLIGPELPAIVEYATPEEWELVENRDAEAWRVAIVRFLDRWAARDFDPEAIAQRMAQRFAPEALQALYRSALEEIILDEVGQ